MPATEGEKTFNFDARKIFVHRKEEKSGHAPLLPVTHAYVTPWPVMHLDGIVVLQAATEVVDPPLEIGTNLPVSASYRGTAISELCS